MRKLKYAILLVNQYLLYTIKFCLTTNDYAILYIILKKWGNLGKNRNFVSVETVVNILTKPDKV